MTWRDAHRRSEEHAAKAQVSMAGTPRLARMLYARAASFEREALSLVPAQLQRTRAILAVSYAALLYKSGQSERTLEALDELSDQHWPNWATDQLEEIRNALAPRKSRRPLRVRKVVKGGAPKKSTRRKLKLKRRQPQMLAARKAMA